LLSVAQVADALGIPLGTVKTHLHRARAALRTPDTTPSQRGPEWVSFSPEALDDQAVDRAEAWFLSAHRLASAVRH